MHFGPLELQACGENNFTMKALGLLAFRPELLRRLVRKLTNSDDLSDDQDVNILFFSRIGEGFFREAIERERNERPGVLEERLNRALGLPQGFRWRRNKNGHLTQPAKWRKEHIDDMLRDNKRLDDHSLHDRLGHLQDCFNTEPDIVLQWGRKLALVEIKVLSPEGQRQLERQKQLAEFLSRLLDWEPPAFFLIGPGHGKPPTRADFNFISWETVAKWFSDVPAIAEYIREFAFLYHGSWQSMVSRNAAAPGHTAYDPLTLNSKKNSSSPAWMESRVDHSIQRTQARPSTDPWHFSHLGKAYFQRIFQNCRGNNIWPLQHIWLGTTGTPYVEKANGRQVNPNWMVEDDQGQRYPKTQYNESHMRLFSYDEIARHYNLGLS